MQEKNDTVLVDPYGKAISSMAQSRWKAILSKNLWNILGPGLAAVITVAGIVEMIFVKSYVISCANFYGIDKKYFSGTEIAGDKVIFLVCAVLVILNPFFLAYINAKVKNRFYIILTFLATVLILFMQNLIYTEAVLERVTDAGLKGVFNHYITFVLFLLSDIVIAYFVILRNEVKKNRKYRKAEKIIAAAAMLLYLLDIAAGISMKMNDRVEDKKKYEIIGTDRAIVSVYEGRFVVMNCKIQGETMILEKGTYQLEQMTGVPIEYKEFAYVICE